MKICDTAECNSALQGDAFARWNSFEQPFTEHRVQTEFIQVHVTDVAAAGFSGAKTRAQCLFKIAFVNIADDVFHEMAPAHVAIAIDAEDGVARAA